MSTRTFDPGKFLWGINRNRQKMTPSNIIEAENNLVEKLPTDTVVGQLTEEDTEFKQFQALRNMLEGHKNTRERIANTCSNKEKSDEYRKIAQMYESEVYFLDCIMSDLLRLAFDSDGSQTGSYYLKKDWIVVKND